MLYNHIMLSLERIGQDLIDARRERGFTQRQLAELIGVHQQQIARWEREKYACVSLSRLVRVAEALGLDATPVKPDDVVPARIPLAAEAPAAYSVATHDAGIVPVRDLGEVVARIRAHADELHERFGVTRIDVFGSFARGEQRPDSDVDLIVELVKPTLETVFGAERRLSEILGRETQAGSIDAINPRVRVNVEGDLVHVWAAKQGGVHR
jgi:hypothetical protein